MKRLIKVILAVLVCLQLDACSSEKNPIAELINKQIELVEKVDEEINDYNQEEDIVEPTYIYEPVYQDFYECLESNPAIIENYHFTAESNEDSFYWIVYIKDDTVVLQWLNQGMSFEAENIHLVCAECCKYDELDYEWRKYSNIINCLIVGTEAEQFDISFSLNDCFLSMDSLKEAHFINCFGVTNLCTSMDDAFSLDHNLKMVDFTNCNFSSVKSIERMFYNCDSLLRCDMDGFYSDSLSTKDLFTNVSQFMLLISNNSNIENAYKLNLNNFEISSADNPVYEMENLYDDISQVRYLENVVDKFQSLSFSRPSDKDFTWVVYQENETIKLSFEFNSYQCFDDQYRIIEFGYCSYDDVNQGWKKYSNLIESIRIWDDNICDFKCSMNGWFKDMTNLKSVEFDHIHSARPMTMCRLFENCSNLETLCFTDCDFSLVSDISKMLYNCRNLQQADLSVFDDNTDLITEELFNGCNAILRINADNNSSIQSEYENWKMYGNEFDAYNNIVYDYPNVYRSIEEIAYKEISSDGQLIHLDWQTGYDIYWAVYERENVIYLTINRYGGTFDANQNLRFIDYGCYTFNNIKQDWKKYGNLIQYIEIFGSSFDPFACSMNGWFSNMTALQQCKFNFVEFADSACLKETFMGCETLQTICFTDCIFTNVNDISRCFKYCNNLQTIAYSHVDEDNKKSSYFPAGIIAEGVFDYCSSLNDSVLLDPSLLNAYKNSIVN